MSDELPDGVQKLSGWEVVEILWPMNDMFRAMLPQLRKTPYDPRHEAEADQILIAWSEGVDPAAAGHASVGAWRVLLERHCQLLALALLNETEGNPHPVSLPAGLSPQDKLIGLSLMLMLRMKLPLEPGDRSKLDIPEGPFRRDWRPN